MEEEKKQEAAVDGLKYGKKYVVRGLQKGEKKEIQDFSLFGENNTYLLEGKKIRMAEVLNKNIVANRFVLTDSTKNEGRDCLSIQLTINGEERVLFTGSGILIKECARYENNMPFCAKIVKRNDYYTFAPIEK